MSLNLFIAVACGVAAILLTVATVRFFFSARQPQTQAAFTDQPADAHASAGDTLRTRRSDNRESIELLTRQLVVSAILTLLVLLPALVRALYPNAVPDWMVDPWVQAIIITPVMFYGGAPIHIDGWDALLRRMPNMNSLASIGTIAAYAYGILVCLFEDALPQPMREPYFEVTGVIVTLVLFARWAVDMWLPRRPASPLQERVDRVSRVWVPITILIALWTFVCWLIFGAQPSFTRALLMGVSVLIIACPAALGWAAPLSVGAALDDAQRYGLTVRTTSALQQAKDTSAVLVAREFAPSAEQAIAQLSGTGVSVAKVDARRTDEAVRALAERRANGATVMFVGDGSEDVRVRDAANIAIACVALDNLEAAPVHADVIAAPTDFACALKLIRLSKATVRNIRENLWWAFIFNLVGIPLAAGVLYPFTGWVLNPMLACVAMILSSICVVLNAVRLRHCKLDGAW